MKTIHKYPLLITDIQTLHLPLAAKILSIQFQEQILTLWAEVYPERETEERIFMVKGTGHVLPLSTDFKKKYITTVQQDGLVWHIYEVNYNPYI